MAKDADQATEVDIYKRPVANITELRIAHCDCAYRTRT